MEAAADADGSFFLAGSTSGSFDGVSMNVGEYDLVVAKIDSDGSLLWSWQVRGVHTAQPLHQIVVHSMFQTGTRTCVCVRVYVCVFLPSSLGAGLHLGV